MFSLSLTHSWCWHVSKYIFLHVFTLTAHFCSCDTYLTWALSLMLLALSPRTKIFHVQLLPRLCSTVSLSTNFVMRSLLVTSSNLFANWFEGVELQAYLDEDVSQTQKQPPSNWAFNKLFPIAHERWKRFRRSVDGYHMSWTMGKWKSTKIHVTFCSFGTKRSRFRVVQLRGMKSGFISRIPRAEHHG